MARDKSSYFSFPTPLEMGSSQPLDGRVVVAQASDLWNAETWTYAGEYTNVYKGMLVSIESGDTSGHSAGDIYEYIGGNGDNIDDVTNSNNWKLIATTHGGDVESKVSNILSESGAGLNSDGTYSADTQTPYISRASNLADADRKIASALSEAVQSIPHFTSGTSGNGSVSFDSGTKTLTLTWSENNTPKSASTTINAESYEFASAATPTQNVAFTTTVPTSGPIQISANVDTIDCGEYTGTDRQ